MLVFNCLDDKGSVIERLYLTNKLKEAHSDSRFSSNSIFSFDKGSIDQYVMSVQHDFFMDYFIK